MKCSESLPRRWLWIHDVLQGRRNLKMESLELYCDHVVRADKLLNTTQDLFEQNSAIVRKTTRP